MIYPSYHTINLSSYSQLKFWVKTSNDLHVEVQQTDNNGPKSRPLWISDYGWDGTNTWQEIIIPKSAFTGIDFTQIFSPFMITGLSGTGTFYVDQVRWV